MTATYQWQLNDWPHYRWNESEISLRLARVRNEQGFLIGRITALGFDVQTSALLDAMTDDVAASSAIEGVRLDHDSVRSSVARQLGLDAEGLPVASHYIEGVVQVLLDAVRHAEEPLSETRLKTWHQALFPMGRSGLWPVRAGEWRQSAEPMQVVSGAIGHETVHYQAPPSADVPQMMKQLLDWINADTAIDPVLKAAVVHLWFVSIHPFEDGNGRIGRTLTDLLMTRADRMPHRFYSLSAAILQDRRGYYGTLESTQRGGLDITEWLVWFLDTVSAAIAHTNGRIQAVLDKADYWHGRPSDMLNPRQRKAITRLLDGFDGKFTSSKYASLNHCSPDTALRDLRDLTEKGFLSQDGSGRSTHYTLLR